MSAFEIDVNGTTLTAALDGDGWIVCQCEVGALPMPGSVLGMQIPDCARVVVHGRHERSSFDSEGLQWADEMLPVSSAVRIRVVRNPAAMSAPRRSAPVPPGEVQEAALKLREEARRFLGTRRRSGLPPAPELSEPVQLGRASMTLRVSGASTRQIVAGAPEGIAVAAVHLRRRGLDESIAIEVRGTSPAHPEAQYFWMRGPLSSDEVVLSVGPEAQPDAPRLLPRDPRLLERYAAALFDLLAKELG